MEIEAKEERYRILVSRILTNKANVGKGLYEIGLDLKEIKERELYLLEFRDFETFLEKKVSLSRTTAYRTIEIAETFTLRDFIKWGLYKLEIIKREFPSETEVENRKEILSQSVPSSEQLESNITNYKLDKGIEQITRFKGQVGLPTKNKEENELKLIRQAQEIIRFKEGLVESIHNWLSASKTSQNQEILQFKEQFEMLLEHLK